MTNTTTEAVNALLDGVTEGPWWTDGEYSVDECGCAIIAARTDCGPMPGNPTRGMVAFASDLLSENANECEANARFIAESRELVPALLAERDAAIARAEKAEAERDAAIRAALDMAAERSSAGEAAISDLLKRLDEAYAPEDGGFTMHTYGQTPDWYVSAAYESCFMADNIRAITVQDVLAKMGAK